MHLLNSSIDIKRLKKKYTIYKNPGKPGKCITRFRLTFLLTFTSYISLIYLYKNTRNALDANYIT